MFVTNVDKADRTLVLRGRNILMAGLALQIISYLVFVVATIIFDIRARRMKGAQLKQLRPLFWASYAVAFLIIGRSVYRAIGVSHVVAIHLSLIRCRIRDSRL